MVYWLRLCTSTAGVTGFIPGQGTKILLHTGAKKIKIKVVNCEWIKMIQHTYTMENYLTTRKKEILLFGTTWMDLEGIILSEMSQTERDKYCMISLIHRI